jgi:hypothetical protein
MTTCLSFRVSLKARLRSKELMPPEGAFRAGDRRLRGPGDEGGKAEVPGKEPGKSPIFALAPIL